MSRNATRGEQRRDSILEAALACFLEKGVDATTLEDIRARSGASTGSIYHLFRGKEHIAGVLFVDAARDYQDGLLAAVRGKDTAEATVRAVVTYYLGWVAASPDRARFLFVTPRSKLEAAVRDELRAMNRDMLRELGAVIRSYVKAGEVRALPPDLFVAVVMGPSHEHARQWLAGVARTPLRQAAPLLADAAWAAVRAG